MRTLAQIGWGILFTAVLTIAAIASRSMPSRAAGATATPTTVAASPADQTPTFREIHMINETTGWAVVSTPDPHNKRDDGLPAWLGYIVRTQDGGQTWENVTPPLGGQVLPPPYLDYSDNGMAGSFFLDDKHAWVMTDDAGLPGNQINNAISLWRTNNSGRLWLKPSTLFAGVAFIAASFIDSAHGWLLLRNLPLDFASPNEPALLYQSTDGGRTWKLIADDGIHPHTDSTGPNAAPISLQNGITDQIHTGMAFESATSGWMTLSLSPDPMHASVMHTTDGGRTWTEVKVAPKATTGDVLDGCDISKLHIYSPGSITFLAFCLEGNYSKAEAFMFQTIDDGVTWESTPLPDKVMVAGTPGVTVPQVFMVDASTGWLVADASTTDASNGGTEATIPVALYQTTDAGKAWTQLTLLPDAFTLVIDPKTFGLPGFEFDFLNERLGFAIDRSGKLWNTKDAGKTWMMMTPKTAALAAAPTATAPAPNGEVTPDVISATSTCFAATPPRLTIGQKARHVLSVMFEQRNVIAADDFATLLYAFRARTRATVRRELHLFRIDLRLQFRTPEHERVSAFARLAQEL